MKNLKPLIVAGVLFFSVLSEMLYAQSDLSRTEWKEQMKKEEKKISAYIDEQMKNIQFNDSLFNSFLSTEEQTDVKETDMAKIKEDYLKGFYRNKYLNSNNEAIKIYNPGSISPIQTVLEKGDGYGATPINISCTGGDFETGSLAGYNGYADAGYISSGGLCSYVPMSNVAYLSVSIPNSNFQITNNIADPNVPALMQTHNGSLHAVRINSSKACKNFYLSMLQKQFSSSVSGKAKINFSYALVMQGPHGSPDESGNSFFVARVLDNLGTEVGTRICVPSIAPGFNTSQTKQCDNGDQIKTLWKDWGCDFLEFDAVAGKTYTIEFFVSGCQWRVHYGYAYVDDICANVSCCPSSPINLKCKITENGNILSWDSVPGAVGYKLIINSNDATCCKNSNYPFTAAWDVSGTDTIVPRNFSTCFSWYVNSICEDGSISQTLQKECSCLPECPAPTHLDCVPVDGGHKLSWSTVSGALGYQLIIHNNDPLCCKNGSLSFMAVWNVTGTDTVVPYSFSPCFSWYVNTICQDSSISETLDKRCSCQPPCTVPINLECKQVTHGNKLSWDPVPGAASYKLVIENNDPLCCKGSSLPFDAVWTIYGTDTIVPDVFTPCFSWYVNTVCLDGTVTNTLIKHCSCGNFPTGLNCTPSTTNGVGGSTLSWSPMAGVSYYKVYYVINDPACCSSGTPINGMLTTSSPSLTVPNTTASCFSWRVVAVMTIGGESLTSETMCSCTNRGERPAGYVDGNQSKDILNPVVNASISVTAIPNPASKYIEFKILNQAEMTYTDLAIHIYDMNGKEIIKNKLTDNSKVTIDVQSYPNGVYVYEISSKNLTIFKDKFIIKKQ